MPIRYGHVYGTGNVGLYDGVVLDEIEVEEKIPCYCRGLSNITDDDVLQRMLHASFVNFSLVKRHPSSSRNTTECYCTDVAEIKLFKTLKVLNLRCFDTTVARFISKLHANGYQGKIIVYEKSRFEGNCDHRSVLDHLDNFAETIKIVPHDKIEVIMKKVNEKEMKAIKVKLSHYIPDDVKISFSD